MRTVQVPMAIDARLTVPLGPLNLSLRALALVIGAGPFAYAALGLPLDGALRLGLAAAVLSSAVIVALPEREGLWVGTWLAARLAQRQLPSLVQGHASESARVRRVGEGLHVGGRHRALALPQPLDRWTTVPRLGSREAGLMQRQPGGWCAVMELAGPEAPPLSEAYALWCDAVVGWLSAVGLPAQIIAWATNLDRGEAEALYEARCERRTRLAERERQLAGQVAARTLLVRNFVLLMPGMAGPDGLPHASRLTRLGEAVDCNRTAAERVLTGALRLAGGFAIDCRAAHPEEIDDLAAATVLGAREATAGAGVVVVDGVHHAQAVVTSLPPRLGAGAVVAALMRARIRGSVSLHLLPVSAATARTHLNRQRAAYRYTSRHSGDLDARLMVSDTEALLAGIASRQVAAMRVAIAVDVCATGLQACEDSMERLQGMLAAEGLRSTRVSVPAFLAATAASPGGVPLSRSLILTTDAVAACLLPAAGTPFGDPAQPLVGVNAGTGAPVYLDVFSRPNHNALVVGTSGAGKSVSVKTMLVRHALQGARVLVIDPDSEYHLIMTALGGDYVELGEASLNVLAVDPGTSPDEAAGLVVPVLSVMGGEEVGYLEGRPIRRLKDADKAWLHAEVATFVASWRDHQGPAEPVLSDLVRHLATEAAGRCSTARMRDRCSEVALRLRGYTQGQRARIFDRPSTFELKSRAMGIGLRELALQFRADLTPALAVVLSRALGMLANGDGRLVILVDEAHRVTSDPDAGHVLDQLVRQARKYGAGVWMASQSVDDFIRTDLGRTLAATAATKLILGIEATVADEARDVFALEQREMDALTPRFVPGRGVLISGPERAVVEIVPGEHLLPLVTTNAGLVRRPVP